MRFLPLLILSALLSSAEYVTLHLRDGRSLNGDYDAASGLLLLDGKASMRMMVKADDVQRVDPATKPAAVAAAEKPVATTKMTATRADIDAAGVIYADLILDYYGGLLAKIEKPVVVEVHKDMTIRQAEEARKVAERAEVYRSIESMLRAARGQSDPAKRASYASSINSQITFMDNGSHVAMRRLLGLPEPHRR